MTDRLDTESYYFGVMYSLQSLIEDIEERPEPIATADEMLDHIKACLTSVVVSREMLKEPLGGMQ